MLTVFNSLYQLRVILSHFLMVLASTSQSLILSRCLVFALMTVFNNDLKKCFSSLLRYSIHLWDLKHPGTWENKGTYVYYTDFIMELAMLFLDLVHHIHMLVRRCAQVSSFIYLTF